MRKIRRFVNLQNWFPADDIVAANVARLCILKEDLEIEFRGLLEPKIQPLDINEISWRKLYFLRNIFRTMMEIHSAIHSLKLNPDFQEAISKQPKSLQEAFEILSNDMLTAHALIKKYRNAIGGHVKEKTIMDALCKVSPKRTGFLEADVTRRQIHLNFTSELCMAVFFDEYPDEEQFEKAEEIISKLKKILPFKAIGAVINTYIDSRYLIKR
jgi:hypothetical protein